MNQSSAERLGKFRQTMKDRGLDAWIGRIVDPHLSEYVPEHWQSVAWLTGFTGSTARLCVTQGAAALLVDSRYWEQAEGELDGAPFEVVRLGAPDAPSQEAWLSQHLTRSRVGLAPELWSESDVRRIRTSLADCGLELALVPDLFDDVWTQGRPARPQTAVTPMTQDSSTVADRLARVREVLRDRASEALCLHSLDDIAWLTGCRAADIKFNPVFLASMIVTDSEALLYTEASRFTPELLGALAAQGIEVRAPESLAGDISALSRDLVFMADPDRLPASIFGLLERVPVEALSPVTLMKSRKSEEELEGIRRAMVSDGVALCEFYALLDERLAEGAVLTESDVANMLDSERAARPDNRGLSFGTISAFGRNAALPHYAPKRETAAVLTDGLLLIDSGGQYEAGTTDITRMTAVGRIDDDMKRDVTLVLKAHIALARAVVPAGVSGSQLDAIARAPLWAKGLDFGHGTGHGVGCRLNVHEGPFHISPRATKTGELGLQAGILVSDEPGLYRPGHRGVRIENLIVARRAASTEFGEFLTFDVATLCPIDLRTVDVSLLTPDEVAWLDDYHGKVLTALQNEALSTRAQAWLKARTAPAFRSRNIV